MNKVLGFVFRNGRYNTAIPTLIISFILQGILIYKYLPQFLVFSESLKNPDQLFVYDSEYLSRLYQVLGKEGRRFYAEMLKIDFLYAAVSGIGYSLLLAALVKKAQWFIMLPLLMAITDILENISQLLLMQRYPNLHALGVVISSVFSSSKMVLGIICISLLLFFITKNIVNGYNHKKLNSNSSNTKMSNNEVI